MDGTFCANFTSAGYPIFFNSFSLCHSTKNDPKMFKKVFFNNAVGIFGALSLKPAIRDQFF